MITDSEIKALADIEQEFRELSVYLDDLSQQKNRDAGHLWIAFTDKFQAFKKMVIADYKAALSGAERVECYLPCTFSESENFISTENGALPLKKTTLTVLNPSKS